MDTPEEMLSCQAGNPQHEDECITHQPVSKLEDLGLKRKLLTEIREDLHAPLDAIIGFTEVLQGAAGQALQLEKQDEYLSLIHKAAMLLHNTLGDKLTDPEFERENTALLLQQFNVADCLNDVFQKAQHAARAKGIKLQAEVPEQEIVINADKQKLQQLTLVLITDAIEASKSGDLILVKVGKFAGRIMVTLKGKHLVPDMGNLKVKPRYISQFVENIVEAHRGNINFAVNSAGIEQIILKLPAGLNQAAQIPFNPANDIINLNENRPGNMCHSNSIEESISVRKTG